MFSVLEGIDSPMNTSRAEHGIGIITINGEDRLAVFGGFELVEYDKFGIYSLNQLKSVELYDQSTQKWEKTNMKLKKPMRGSRFLSVKGKAIADFMTF